MKTTPLNSFLKFYVMSSPGIDLYGIAHVKVDFFPLQKMDVIPLLGRFVWTTSFVQCGVLLVEIFTSQNVYCSDFSLFRKNGTSITFSVRTFFEKYVQGVPRQSVTLYTVFSVGYKDVYGILWYIVCSKLHNVLFGWSFDVSRLFTCLKNHKKMNIFKKNWNFISKNFWNLFFNFFPHKYAF